MKKVNEVKKLKITLVIETSCDEIELIIKSTPSTTHHDNQHPEKTTLDHLKIATTDHGDTNGAGEEAPGDKNNGQEIVIVDEVPV